MNLLIKPAIVLGALIGGVLGVILLVPYIQGLSCFLFAFTGAAIIFYLKRNNLTGVLSLQDGALIGSVSGFTSIITASVILVPIAFILNMIFSSQLKTGINLITSFISFSYSIFALLMIIFFIAMLSSLFNAFSALIVAYIYEKIECNNNIPEERTDILLDK